MNYECKHGTKIQCIMFIITRPAWYPFKRMSERAIVSVTVKPNSICIAVYLKEFKNVKLNRRQSAVIQKV